jgi:hypothetical protein
VLGLLQYWVKMQQDPYIEDEVFLEAYVAAEPISFTQL